MNLQEPQLGEGDKLPKEGEKPIGLNEAQIRFNKEFTSNSLPDSEGVTNEPLPDKGTDVQGEAPESPEVSETEAKYLLPDDFDIEAKNNKEKIIVDTLKAARDLNQANPSHKNLLLGIASKLLQEIDLLEENEQIDEEDIEAILQDLS